MKKGLFSIIAVATLVLGCAKTQVGTFLSKSQSNLPKAQQELAPPNQPTPSELEPGPEPEPAPLTETKKFLDVINQFRNDLGLEKLKQDTRLDEAARKHALWMRRWNVLTHSGPMLRMGVAARAINEGIDANVLVGENIARGSWTAKDTFKQWFFSKPHLQGMMTAEYDHIGIAREGCVENSPADLLDQIADENISWNCFWVTDFADLENNDQEVASPQITPALILKAGARILGEFTESEATPIKNFFLLESI